MSGTPSNTIRACVDWATLQFENSNVYFGHGCDNPRDEAIWATMHVAGLMDREYEQVADLSLDGKLRASVAQLIRQRIESRKPLAYLIGEAWFAGHPFFIDERAIVPRSHFSDLIQDGFGPWISPHQLHRALDLCCGSGCIALALALAFPQLQVDAADIDSAALQVAEVNIERYRLNGRINVIQSDLFAGLAKEKYDLIICNPPYIAMSLIDQLPDEYLHEPRHAFAGGSDGLKFVRQILAQAERYLTDNGTLLIELGDNADALENAYPHVPFLWLTSRSGQSVVMLLSRQDLETHRDQLN